MLPVEIDHQSRRHGDGWVMWVSPTRLVMILDDDDEQAGSRALDDLGGWGDPEDWTLVQSGWYDDGTTYFVYDWLPE